MVPVLVVSFVFDLSLFLAFSFMAFWCWCLSGDSRRTKFDSFSGTSMKHRSASSVLHSSPSPMQIESLLGRSCIECQILIWHVMGKQLLANLPYSVMRWIHRDHIFGQIQCPFRHLVRGHHGTQVRGRLEVLVWVGDGRQWHGTRARAIIQINWGDRCPFGIGGICSLHDLSVDIAVRSLRVEE